MATDPASGSWLVYQIKDCVKEVTGEAATQQTIDQVLRRLPEHVRAVLSKKARKKDKDKPQP